MNRKHEITIIKALPTLKQRKWNYKPSMTTKIFKDGLEQENYPGKWWEQKIVKWRNLKDLYRTLEPYIKGTHKDAMYSALMYGQFIDGTEEIDGTRRLNINIEDTPHNYFILDIETSSIFPELCWNLQDVRQWLIGSYPWITEDTGMILYHTASAGVERKDGLEKHKQIRVRAILEIDCAFPLRESQRKELLRPYMKMDGDLDFYRHIDPCTHEKARIFYMAPPVLTNTRRHIESDDMCCLHEGAPIDFELLRDFEIGLPIDKQANGKVRSPVRSISDNPSRRLKQTPPEEFFNKISDGNRYENIFNTLGSAFFRDCHEEWKQKLLTIDLGDRDESTLDAIIKWQNETMVKDFDKPKDKIWKHNVIDIDEYRLDKWDDTIAWKDKGVILQKLYEGAGKTQSLKQLKELTDKQGMSFLYMAPNTKPVVTACKDLGLSCYQGLGEEVAETNSDGEPIHSYLGICYPSLQYIGGSTYRSIKKIKWDVIVMDEIEQLLVFATESGDCIKDPEKNNSILRYLVEKADLVVGMDARLSNLSLQTLEAWRPEKTYDIYTQSKIQPWLGKTFTMVDNKQITMNYIYEAVSKGKKVAIVSELTRSGRGLSLETGRKYIEEMTGKMGWSIDQNNKNTPESNRYINELGKWNDEGLWEIGALEQDLIDGKISHVWISPVLQSAWSYLSEEANFDLVVGLYPKRVLTAPNIIQHISRFRKTKEFVMHIHQHKRFQPYETYNQIYKDIFEVKDGEEIIVEELNEFNDRHELETHYKKLQLDNRYVHFCDEAEKRGANIEYDGTQFVAPFGKGNEDDKQLYTWLKEHHEKAWKFITSEEAWEYRSKFAFKEPIFELEEISRPAPENSKTLSND